MANRLSIPIAELALPVACAACDARPAKLFKLRISQNIDLLFARRERWYTLPVPLCLACHKRRIRTAIAAWLLVVAAFLALAFGGLVLAIDYDSPLAAVAFGLLFCLALFVRLGLDDLLAWRAVGLHGVLLRGSPPRARLAVRRADLFNKLRASSPNARPA
jgi:hypothetical protein